MRGIIALAGLLATPAVWGLDLPDGNRWFIAGNAGISLQRDQDGSLLTVTSPLSIGALTATADSALISLDFETGLALGVRAGYAFEPFDSPAGPIQIRVALDHLYRENDAASAEPALATLLADGQSQVVFPQVMVEGDQSSNAFHATGLIEFHGLDRFVPYFGVGAGIAGVESDLVLVASNADGEEIRQSYGGSVDAEFSYQILGGVKYRVTDRFDVLVEGRFIETNEPDFDLEQPGGAPVAFDADFSHFHVTAGVQFSF